MLPLPEFETSPAPPPPTASVPVVYVFEPAVWEYKQITGERALDETALNDLGREGWELAAVLDHDSRLVFYFKRQLR